MNKERLIQLWREGKTGTQIAEELGTTRNAVLGAVHRLKARGILEARVSGPNLKPVKKSIKGRVRRRKFFMPTEPLPPEPQVEISSKPKTLLDLRMDDCRYIVKQGDPMSTLYCGAPTHVKSYCEAHAQLCYVQISKAKRKSPWRSRTRFRALNFSRTAPYDTTINE